MSKYQLLILRFILFLAGAGIVLFAFFLFNEDQYLDPEDVFMWVSIGVMYLVFFLPFFFSSINISNFSKKIPSISMVWVGNLVYVAASIILIYMLVKEKVVIKTAIIIQLVMFFIYLINVYFAYFAVSHAAKVAEEEEDKKYYLTDIKSKTGTLLLLADKLPGEYESAQKILKKSIEDVRYISPADNGGGLELKILESLGSLSQLLDNVLSGAQNPGLEKEAEKLQLLVNERKLIRN